METATKKLYEGMFLVDSAQAARDWDGVLGAIQRILERAGADIISIRKWYERPLAYEIKKVSRGTYILTYFRADGRKVREIEREVQLSEVIMRALVLVADHLTQEDVAEETPAMRGEREARETEERRRKQEEKAKEEPRQEPEVQGSSEKPSGNEDDKQQALKGTAEGEQSDERDEQSGAAMAPGEDSQMGPVGSANVADKHAETGDDQPVGEQGPASQAAIEGPSSPEPGAGDKSEQKASET